MKKLSVSLLLMVAMLLALCFPVLSANVVLSPQNLIVDGGEVECEKYNIDGRNYFKLRDLAYLLNGTNSQFSVEWDKDSSTVSILTGNPYTSDGSELDVSRGDKASTAIRSAQSIQIDGETRKDLMAYNIGGYNFFQLRELAEALGFDVDYNSNTNTAVVTSKMYKARGISLQLSQPKFDSSWGGYYYTDLSIKNEDVTDIYYEVEYLKINGFQLETSVYGTIYSGMEASVKISFSSDDLKLANIEHILYIEVGLELSESENHRNTIDTPVLLLRTPDAWKYVQSYDFGWEEVYNEKGIRIFARFGDSSETNAVVFYVENNSGSEITLLYRNVAINGKMVGELFSGARIRDGAKCATGLQRFLLKMTGEALPENNDINSVVLKFSIMPFRPDGSFSTGDMYDSGKIVITR